jgi:hypothetical protein
MVFLKELWMPILVSAVAVFMVSAAMWMAMPHHKTEYKRIPSEPDVLDALRKDQPPAGMYRFPFHSMQEMERPDVKAALAKGPIGFVTIAKPGSRGMGPMLVQSFLFYIIVSTFVAYIAWHAGLGLDATKASIVRLVGTITLMTYGFGVAQESIWFARPWKSYAASLFDAAVYAGVTAGIFGWLWPK